MCPNVPVRRADDLVVVRRGRSALVGDQHQLEGAGVTGYGRGVQVRALRADIIEGIDLADRAARHREDRNAPEASARVRRVIGFPPFGIRQSALVRQPSAIGNPNVAGPRLSIAQTGDSGERKDDIRSGYSLRDPDLAAAAPHRENTLLKGCKTPVMLTFRAPSALPYCRAAQATTPSMQASKASCGPASHCRRRRALRSREPVVCAGHDVGDEHSRWIVPPPRDPGSRKFRHFSYRVGLDRKRPIGDGRPHRRRPAPTVARPRHCTRLVPRRSSAVTRLLLGLCNGRRDGGSDGLRRRH